MWKFTGIENRFEGYECYPEQIIKIYDFATRPMKNLTEDDDLQFYTIGQQESSIFRVLSCLKLHCWLYSSSNNKTLNARLLARVITSWCNIPIVTTRPFSLPCYLQDSENDRVVTIGKHSRLNRQIWYRHLNSEAGNDKVVANFEKHTFLSQTDLTRTGIISNCYNEMFEA
jgi:hypothetical protein